MMYLNREIRDKFREMFTQFSVLCLIGSRQVGKSTLVQNLWDDPIETVTFDPIEDIENARKDPDFFLQNHNTPLFLDEIQYAPEILNALKRKVDREKKKGMYVLSGSQNISVLKSISESLAGRIAILELPPMSFKEKIGEGTREGFLKKFLENETLPKKKEIVFPNISKEIWRGGFPGTLTLADTWIPSFYQSLKTTYIERDVRIVGGVSDVMEFSNFVTLVSILSGTEINFSELGRELNIDRKTAERWLNILEYSFLWKSIPPFHKNSIKRISHKKKGFFVDTGLACAMQKISDSRVVLSLPHFGRLFESFVFAEIFKSLQRYSIQPNYYYFRTNGGAEVDLILEIDGKLFPVEIKATANPKKDAEKGIKKFRETFPKENIRTGLLLSSVEKPYKISETLVTVPWWYL
ncbi:MAG: ATP-binding protein [Leptospiraceae bacterium]|nr:ATP-binding protein [Leptospiraceae bacterium]